MLKGIRFLKRIKKRLRSKRVAKNNDVIPIEVLEKKLGNIHQLLLIVNGDLVVQKNVETGTDNNNPKDSIQ